MRLFICLFVCLSSLACDGPSVERLNVPTSDVCSQGVYPLACTTVPPRVGAVAITDAILAPDEYYGAVELPIANMALQDANGQMFVTLDDETSALRVFLQDVAVNIQQGTLSVLIDHDRYAREDSTFLDAPDRRYTVDLQNGNRFVDVALQTSGVPEWIRTAGEPTFDAVKECRRFEDPVRYRCDVEFSIPLDEEDRIEPAEGLLAGIGFAVSDGRRELVFPEELADGMTDDILLNRRRYVTLLFGEPESVPFTFMSWNLAHWDTDLEYNITQSPFDIVEMSDLAQVMAPYDIVAVQEMWNKKDAEVLLLEINQRRSDAGLPLMQLYGPAAASMDALHSLGINVTGEPQAGLFIFSHFRAAAIGYDIYDDCRGEDCLKPKGVQWVRLLLNDANSDDLRPECTTQLDPFADCGPVPTDEMYIDIFNTHPQADPSFVCTETDIAGDYEALLLLACPLVPLPPGVCELAVGGLVGVNFYCDSTSDFEVRAAQLRQMAAYIEVVTGPESDHPILIAGDLNVNGRTTNRAEYQSMLQTFGLARGTDPADDSLSPDSEAFAWDLDHADVAREMDRWQWDHCGTGTSIGKGRSNDGDLDGRTPAGVRVLDCLPAMCSLNRVEIGNDMVERADGDTRLDYIMSAPVDLSNPAAYVISRGGGAVWRPLWPAVDRFHLCAAWDGAQTTLPNMLTTARLSDHRPILASLKLSILRQPGRYHRDWNHVVVSSVHSVDVSAEEDCWLNLCGPSDPYVEFVGNSYTPDNTITPITGPLSRTVCNNQDEGSLSWPHNACMNDWFQDTDVVEPEVFASHEIAWRLFEDDDDGGNQEFFTIDGDSDGVRDDHPLFRVLWGTGGSTPSFDVSRQRSRRADPPGWRGPTPILTSDPFRWCTGIGSPSLCVVTEINEVP